MGGLVTTLRDAMNPHKRLVISNPEKQKTSAVAIKQMLNRAGGGSWGWEVSDKRIVFRVYKPHQYTAKGLLEEKDIKMD